MAVGKEIRAQIASIQNTQKITKAMQMVAASKMRKAQDRMDASRPSAQLNRSMKPQVAAVGVKSAGAQAGNRPMPTRSSARTIQKLSRFR